MTTLHSDSDASFVDRCSSLFTAAAAVATTFAGCVQGKSSRTSGTLLWLPLTISKQVCFKTKTLHRRVDCKVFHGNISGVSIHCKDNKFFSHCAHNFYSYSGNIYQLQGQQDFSHCAHTFFIPIYLSYLSFYTLFFLLLILLTLLL